MTPTHTPASLLLAQAYDFDLPDDLIAQHPAPQRSASRLLDGRQHPPTDRIFRDLPSLLGPNDLLIFNDTQVVKARIYGQKSTGGQLELLIERVLTADEDGVHRNVVAHMRVSKKPPVGGQLWMAGYSPAEPTKGFLATLEGRWPDENGSLFRLRLNRDAYSMMQEHGHVPLPPYITHGDSTEDEHRYQTVFAKHPGAVAAPTAALHFDEDVLQQLRARGVQTASVTLHVGAGTFAPVKSELITDHAMHHERYQVPSTTVQAIQACRERKGRVVAVGTTSVRTLESWAQSGALQGDTNIFIYPGYPFQVVDLLITNFHLPRSTLMMLVSAFAGHAHIMGLYQEAVQRRYRFFSYGDAMLLERTHVGI